MQSFCDHDELHVIFSDSRSWCVARVWLEFGTSLHKFGMRFARVLHEFVRAEEFGTSVARVWHGFCTSLTRG